MSETAPRYVVVISELARIDLLKIAAYIAQQSPENVSRVRDMLMGAIAGLDHLPGRFRVHTETRGNAPVHALAVRPFVIYYRVDEAGRTTTILRVMHGAQQQPRRFH